MMLALQYDFVEGVLKSVICIGVVFAMLYLLTLVVQVLKPLADKTPASDKETKQEPAAVAAAAKPFGVEDIKDEDMMVAVLVAAIDYRETTKQECNVVSAKEIQ
ncbi:MAG TPA: hypothetical protein DCR44_02315 [Acholeplasmatales bacterium]|nr:MAG: hypothetical protein A2Y16_01680 [Tenericutes bacterium GWF2_57_13]HAQ56226.1 hypothetical protein [Acholeplasmatales bacterium]